MWIHIFHGKIICFTYISISEHIHKRLLNNNRQRYQFKQHDHHGKNKSSMSTLLETCPSSKLFNRSHQPWDPVPSSKPYTIPLYFTLRHSVIRLLSLAEPDFPHAKAPGATWFDTDERERVTPKIRSSGWIHRPLGLQKLSTQPKSFPLLTNKGIYPLKDKRSKRHQHTYKRKITHSAHHI